MPSPSCERIFGGIPENLSLLENATTHRPNPWGAIGGGEGFAVADIDIGEAIVLKEAHDIIGRYNRFDVFQLRVNQTRIKPVRLYESASTFEDYVLAL
jgi:hypothetical protein